VTFDENILPQSKSLLPHLMMAEDICGHTHIKWKEEVCQLCDCDSIQSHNCDNKGAPVR